MEGRSPGKPGKSRQALRGCFKFERPVGIIYILCRESQGQGQGHGRECSKGHAYRSCVTSRSLLSLEEPENNIERACDVRECARVGREEKDKPGQQ